MLNPYAGFDSNVPTALSEHPANVYDNVLNGHASLFESGDLKMKIHRSTEELDVNDSDLSGSVFNNAYLASTKFNQINFSGASFNDSNMSGWRVNDVNLSGAILDNANLSGVALKNCHMAGFTIDGIAYEDLLSAYKSAQT